MLRNIRSVFQRCPDNRDSNVAAAIIKNAYSPCSSSSYNCIRIAAVDSEAVSSSYSCIRIAAVDSEAVSSSNSCIRIAAVDSEAVSSSNSRAQSKLGFCPLRGGVLHFWGRSFLKTKHSNEVHDADSET